MGQSPKVFFYHFYPVAERAPSAKIPLDGILLGAAGIRSTEYGYTKICTNEKQGAKIPLLKVLEILKNFFQEVFKQGLGQSPKVLNPPDFSTPVFNSLWKKRKSKAAGEGKSAKRCA